MWWCGWYRSKFSPLAPQSRVESGVGWMLSVVQCTDPSLTRLDCLVCHYTAIACGYSQYSLATTATTTTNTTNTFIHHAANGIFVYMLRSFKNTPWKYSGSLSVLRVVTISLLVIIALRWAVSTCSLSLLSQPGLRENCWTSVLYCVLMWWFRTGEV